MGKRQHMALGALALLLAAGLAGCGAPPEPSPTPAATASPSPTPQARPMEFALPCYPQASFHPITGTGRTNLALAGLMYDGLYELDQSFEPRPALAVSHTVSENGLVWTFTLRQGVTFSDGSSLTPADVVYSLDLARSSALYAARLAQVAGVRAGEGTVEVTLSAPHGALPALLDVPMVRQGNDQRPAGTGLYVLEGDDTGLSLRRRSGGWRQGTPEPETIPLRPVEQAEDLVYLFDTREISLADTDFTGTNSLGFSGSFETVDYPTADMLFVGFNTAGGVCRDAAVRRALSLGMDRTTICTGLLSRHAAEAVLPVHPGSAAYDKTLAETAAYSPQAMAQGLEQAGWSKSGGKYSRWGRQMELTLLVNQDSACKLDVADELARELTAAGVGVTVKKLAWSDYVDALERGDFDLYLGEVLLTGDFDPSPLLAGGALNYGKYTGGELTGALSAWRAAQGAARTAAGRVFYTRLLEEAPFTVLCFKNRSALTQWGQVSGMTPTQQNLFYRFADWEVTK